MQYHSSSWSRASGLTFSCSPVKIEKHIIIIINQSTSTPAWCPQRFPSRTFWGWLHPAAPLGEATRFFWWGLPLIIIIKWRYMAIIWWNFWSSGESTTEKDSFFLAGIAYRLHACVCTVWNHLLFSPARRDGQIGWQWDVAWMFYSCFPGINLTISASLWRVWRANIRMINVPSTHGTFTKMTEDLGMGMLRNRHLRRVGWLSLRFSLRH